MQSIYPRSHYFVSIFREYGDDPWILYYLFSNGLPPESEDEFDRGFIHYVVMFDCINCLRYLHWLGVNIDSYDFNGETPCHYAARYGSIQCLMYLVENRCGFRKPSLLGKSAMILTRNYRNGLCYEYLNNVLDDQRERKEKKNNLQK